MIRYNGEEINAETKINNILRNVGINITLPDLLVRYNDEIIQEHNSLSVDPSYNRNPFIYYLNFINFFKNCDPNRADFIQNFLDLQTSIILYQQMLLNPSKYCSVTDIAARIDNDIGMLNNIQQEFQSIQMNNVINNVINDNIYPLYEDILEIYNSDDVLHEKNLIDDIKLSFNLDYPSYYSYYQRKKDIDIPDEKEEESKMFLKERDIKEVIFPSNGDDLEYMKIR
jgi:hypothetical protein